MKKDSLRLLAIAGAIVVPLTAWIYVDYLASISTKPATPEVAPQVQAPPPPQERIETKANDALVSFPQAAAPRYAPGTYRCKSKGHTAYTDKPERDCEASSPIVLVKVAPATAGFAPDKPYPQQLAELEQRQAAEAALRSTRAPPTQHVSDQHESRCQALWNQIQQIDSLMRQPHSAAQADYWAGQRRELSSLRYAERC